MHKMYLFKIKNSWFCIYGHKVHNSRSIYYYKCLNNNRFFYIPLISYFKYQFNATLHRWGQQQMKFTNYKIIFWLQCIAKNYTKFVKNYIQHVKHYEICIINLKNISETLCISDGVFHLDFIFNKSNAFWAQHCSTYDSLYRCGLTGLWKSIVDINLVIHPVS